MSTFKRVARRLPGIRGVGTTLDHTTAGRDRLEWERDELAARLRAEGDGRDTLRQERKNPAESLADEPPATKPSFKAATFEKVQARLLSTARKQSTVFGRTVAGELWAHGFLPDKARLYAIGHYGPDAYLSDLQREMARLINEPYSAILSNKAIFNEVFGEVVPTVPILGYTNGHGFIGELPDGATLFAKPVNNGGGGGVFRATVKNGRLIVGDRTLSRTAFINDLLTRTKHYIVSPAVESHPDMKQFFDRTTNTLRILMMRCPVTGEGFIAGAVLRIGTIASGDIDNFTGGGISFAVEVGSGVIGTGWQLRQLLDAECDRDPEKEPDAIFVHPDTGARITGHRVPMWDDVIEICRTAFEHCQRLQCVGWDIVVTPSGPALLEGNHYPEPRVLQVHEPLLSDGRVRAFYDHHGILDWQPTEPL